MVAATRAILNGVTSTGPCPYAANGIAAWISATLPAGISSSFAVSLERLRAHRENTQLREIRVARNRDGAMPWSSVPCAESPTSSRIGLRHPGMIAPTRPSGSRRQLKLLFFQLRIQAQRGHRGHQLERRARRILAVARAIEQFVGRGLDVASARARSPAPARRPMFGSITTTAPLSLCAFASRSSSALSTRICRRISMDVVTLRSRAISFAICRIPRLMPVADQRRQLADNP